MVMVASEVNRLQKLQNALDLFGATRMVAAILGGVSNKSFRDSFFNEFAPLAMVLLLLLLFNNYPRMNDS